MSALYGPPLAGAFRWPRGFGTQRTATHRHQGLDFDVEAGRKWLAVADGVVEHAQSEPARQFAGYGRVVVLRFQDADGRTLRALYAHGKSVAVTPGQSVHVGDVLGEVGQSQFRTAAMLQRAHVPVPAGYTPAMDDGHVARGTGRVMAPHLHFELSTHTYPQGSEAPTRIDPARWFLERGVARLRGGVGPSRPHDAPHGSAPWQVDVVNRTTQTGQRIALLSAQLNAAGHSDVATAIVQAWTAARTAILAAVQASDPTRARAAVSGWLDAARGFASRAVALLGDAAGAAVDAQVAALAAIWDGVAWVAERAAAMAVAPLVPLVAPPLGGAALIALGLAGWWLLTMGTGAGYLYSRRRRRQ